MPQQEYTEEMAFDEALAVAMGQEVEPVHVNDPAQRQPEPGQKDIEELRASTGEKKTEDVQKEKTPEPELEARPAELPPEVRAIIEEHKALKAKVDQIEFEDDKPPVSQTPDNTLELDIKEKFVADPITTIMELAEAAKIKPAVLAQDLWYEFQGDKAPSEYRAVKEARAAKLQTALAQSATKKAQETREVQQRLQEQQDVVNRYIGSLEDFAKEAPAEKYQLVRAFAESAPQKTVGWLWSAANTLAQQKGSPPTPEESAAELEKELAELAPVFLKIMEQKEQKSEERKQGVSEQETRNDETPNTLRSNSDSVQPDRKEEDPYSDEVLRRNARKAMAELGVDLPVDY